MSHKQIIDQYSFVADFTMKEPERNISDNNFWKYPFKLPKLNFDPDFEWEEAKNEIEPTSSLGRSAEHLNLGRVKFFAKDFEGARNTWLSARARYGKEMEFHRRVDYYIAMAFMALGLENLKKLNYDWNHPDVSNNMSNAATFLSWAFVIKRNTPDPLLDRVMPRGLFNLAAIYWRYDRFSAAFGVADQALDFLRTNGRVDHQVDFHRIRIESFVKNRSYLEAMREIDTAIRLIPNPNQTALLFARAGDIYFHLNNYELAEDVYGIANKIDADLDLIQPAQLALRAESLFWLGKFDKAQKIFDFALDGHRFRKQRVAMTEEARAFAMLRLADSYLALGKDKKAALEYYKVYHQFSKTEAARVAEVRQICLELPSYDKDREGNRMTNYNGKNISHARGFLKNIRENGANLPYRMLEVAGACEAVSYTDRERTPEMLAIIKDFHSKYPESHFLKGFYNPVKELQAQKFHDFFHAGEFNKAISFYETYEKILYSQIEAEMRRKLFIAYANVYRPKKAAEFWDEYQNVPDADIKFIRMAAISSELYDMTKDEKWKLRSKKVAKSLEGYQWHDGQHGKRFSDYLRRLLHVSLASEHLLWIEKMANGWANDDLDTLCQIQEVVLQKMLRETPQHKQIVRDRVSGLVKKHLPYLLKQKAYASCGISFLDLEFQIEKNNAELLAETYLARTDWPIRGEVMEYFLSVAEQAHAAGLTEKAEQIFQLVAQKGPQDSVGVQISRQRLDKSRTQLENLWQ